MYSVVSLSLAFEQAELFSVRRLILSLAAALAFVAAPAEADRIKDLGGFQGIRSNQLTGYGVVVGLPGTGDDNLEYTVQSLKAVASRFGLQLPPGYRVSIGGVSQQQQKSFGQLFTALGASVMLAYLLMAVLYNSLATPLVILFSLPVAIGGAMFGLFVFGYHFSVFSMIGLILLVGLAIKNGILLVDRTNQNRERGLSMQDALLEAGPARLRAILMTSVTIAIALLPSQSGFQDLGALLARQPGVAARARMRRQTQ